MTITTTQRDEAAHKLRMSRACDYLRMLRKRKADYAASVDEWYRSGDGRSPKFVDAHTQDWFEPGHDDPYRGVNVGGKGYRYPVCIHGVSLWTDYDCACGACEDGVSDRELALTWAGLDVSVWQSRLDMVQRAQDLNAPRETVLALIDWMVETIQPIDPRPLDPKRLP